ncbi:MAG: acylphosphatase [Candidatus Methanoperedens sp.]
MQKCHSIIVTGKVQDIGFRSIVEHIGRSLGIPGLVFNARDGSVKILCSGEDSVVDNFTQAIRVRGEENGSEIASINEKTLAINIDLPDEFSKVSSDDEIDIGRKLDKANILLKTGFDNLNTDLNAGFDNLKTDLNAGFNNLKTDLNAGFDNLKTDLNAGFNNLNTDLNAGFNNLNTDLNAGFNKMTDMLGTFIVEQKVYNRGQQEHNTRLEAILEKISRR